MTPTKNQEELSKILQYFDVPELTFDDAVEAGPDERLYLLHDDQNQKYAVWARDYMGELEHEATGLKNNQNITVESWLPIKSPTGEEKYRYCLDGDEYAVAKIK